MGKLIKIDFSPRAKGIRSLNKSLKKDKQEKRLEHRIQKLYKRRGIQ